MGIPAFGEWNYDNGGDGDDDWSVLSQRFESAMMQIQFPVHKSCRKRARSGRRRHVPAFGLWNNDHSEHKSHGGWTAAVNQCFDPAVSARKSHEQVEIWDDSGVAAMGKQQHKVRQTWVDDSRLHEGMEPFSFTLVEAVDDDLYEVPSDMLSNNSIRRKGRTTWLRSLLTRCFGLNCFA